MVDKFIKNNISKVIVNGGIYSFVFVVLLELERGIWINVISPGKVLDILVNDLVNVYLKSVESFINGEIIKVNY